MFAYFTPRLRYHLYPGANAQSCIQKFRIRDEIENMGKYMI